jgi:hypothetical protein
MKVAIKVQDKSQAIGYTQPARMMAGKWAKAAK